MSGWRRPRRARRRWVGPQRRNIFKINRVKRVLEEAGAAGSGTPLLSEIFRGRDLAFCVPRLKDAFFFFFPSCKGNLERCWVRNNPPCVVCRKALWWGEVQSRGLVGGFWGAGELPMTPQSSSIPTGGQGQCCAPSLRGLRPSIHPCPPQQHQTRGMLWGGETGAGSGPVGSHHVFPMPTAKTHQLGMTQGVPRTAVPSLPCTVAICPPPQNAKEGKEGWEKPTPVLSLLCPAPSPGSPCCFGAAAAAPAAEIGPVSASPPHPQQI